MCLLEWHSLDDLNVLHLMTAFAQRTSHVLSVTGLDVDVAEL